MIDNKKQGWLVILCGAWNVVIGSLFGVAFIFFWFDIGNGYQRVGQVYGIIARNISWGGIILLGVASLSAILLMTAGVMLFLSRPSNIILRLGMGSMYLYVAGFVVIATLLMFSGGSILATIIWIAMAFISLWPQYFLRREFRGHNT